MKNLNDLRDKAYQCAVAHGWHEGNLSDEHFLCLVISELMEAVEADRKGKNADTKKFNQELDYYIHEMKLYGENYDKAYRDTFEYYLKDSVEDELSDACIRLLDLAGLRNCELLYMDSLYIEEISFTEFSYMFCSFITNPDKSQKDWLKLHISCSLGRIFSWCRAKNIDIAWHIEQKMKYNELRPFMHGGKAY
ncbi:hypothetical protein Q3C19_09015 [Bacteroides sp. ET489]|uniref:hypothetical protein n=1 Tax=Bacteroides sp. ET489 TaxID=3057126 RepID=UPI00267212D7|nr:hypothetical protein [Bacteroides sp. ET489]MDO3390614.1 hypothetical protein [Bacteroides sp. ET489]